MFLVLCFWKNSKAPRWSPSWKRLKTTTINSFSFCKAMFYFQQAPFCICRLAWRWLLNKLPEWYLGSWLQCNLYVCQWRSLQCSVWDLYLCTWVERGEMRVSLSGNQATYNDWLWHSTQVLEFILSHIPKQFICLYSMLILCEGSLHTVQQWVLCSYICCRFKKVLCTQLTTMLWKIVLMFANNFKTNTFQNNTLYKRITCLDYVKKI